MALPLLSVLLLLLLLLPFLHSSCSSVLVRPSAMRWDPGRENDGEHEHLTSLSSSRPSSSTGNTSRAYQHTTSQPATMQGHSVRQPATSRPCVQCPPE